MICTDILSLMLSLLAVLVSLITFWYVSLRNGKIIIENPISFKSMGSPDDPNRIPIQFPLVFTNTGSKSKILTKISLIEEKNNIVFIYTALLSNISIFDTDERIAIQPIVLPPFSSVLIKIEFMSSEIKFSYGKDPIIFKVIAKVYNSKKEVRIGIINLKVADHLAKKLNEKMRIVENLNHWNYFVGEKIWKLNISGI